MSAGAGIAIVLVLALALVVPVALYLAVQSEVETENMDRATAERVARKDGGVDGASGGDRSRTDADEWGTAGRDEDDDRWSR